jgi:endonuclease-3
VYHTPFQLLVSVVLSAQTTDKSVNRCMEPLYAKGFGIDDVLSLGEKGFYPLVRTIGLAPTKTRHVVKLAAILRESHGGEVPRAREALEALPGVGRKTANVVLGEIWGEPTLAVDTHVFRLGARLGWHREKTPAKAEMAMLKVIPHGWLPRAHHWLVLHGRYVCVARKPKCGECALRELCPSRVEEK